MSHKLETVDKILAKLAKLGEAIREMEAQAEAELAPLRQKWEARMAPLRDELTLLDKVILDMARRNRQEFFAAADLVDLRHGFLIYARRQVVRKARGVLALLESLKWEEAIQRTAKVRWGVLADWPEARLISCGTERVEQVSFAYEIKTPGQIYRDVARRGPGGG
ncbi:MAG: hypothetical protein FJ121_13645 [Deltaproteobacteria bacterium]|nr:hypothetical protein [Deltaproteobacteria bacterium]